MTPRLAWAEVKRAAQVIRRERERGPFVGSPEMVGAMARLELVVRDVKRWECRRGKEQVR